MNKTVKKYILGFGTIAIVAAPVVTVVSCQTVKWEKAPITLEQEVNRIKNLEMKGVQTDFTIIGVDPLDPTSTPFKFSRHYIDPIQKSISDSINFQMINPSNDAIEQGFEYFVSAPARTAQDTSLKLTITVKLGTEEETFEKVIGLVNPHEAALLAANAEQAYVNSLPPLEGRLSSTFILPLVDKDFESDLTDAEKNALGLLSVDDNGERIFNPNLEMFKYKISSSPADTTTTDIWDLKIKVINKNNGGTEIPATTKPTNLRVIRYPDSYFGVTQNPGVTNTNPTANGLDAQKSPLSTGGEQVTFSFAKDSDALENVLASIGASGLDEQKVGDALDAIETALRTFAITLAVADAPMGPTIEYWANLFVAPNTEFGAISVGTYQSDTATATDPDDHIEIGIGGLTSNLAMKFLKDANTYFTANPTLLTGDAKLMWDAMIAEINLLPTTP